MMKGVFVLSTVTAIGTVGAVVAETVEPGFPGLGAVGQLTATGAMIYLVVWLTTKTFPAMLQKANEAQAATAKTLMDFQDKANAMQQKSNELTGQLARDFHEQLEKQREHDHTETELLRDRVVHTVEGMAQEVKGELGIRKFEGQNRPKPG